MEKKKVVVGMSGGVDSSVAAWLLKNQGYDVIGVTMQIWQDEEEAAMEEHGGCCGLSAVDDARRVAAALDIPYYVMNFKKEFKENVIDYFIDDYLHGRTPNPCIACNRYVKWESLLKRSLDIGAEYIATGHYARVEKLMGNISAEGFDVNNNTVIQLISCTIGCTGYASWFKIRGKKILYSSVGAFLTWGIYLLVYAWYPDNFFAVVVASCFVAGYAFVMSRVNHAPSTVFLTASVFPLMPGARLYYLMYGVVR